MSTMYRFSENIDARTHIAESLELAELNTPALDLVSDRISVSFGDALNPADESPFFAALMQAVEVAKYEYKSDDEWYTIAGFEAVARAECEDHFTDL